MGYFALGDGTAESGAAYLRRYYAFTGPFAEKIAAGNLTSPGAIIDFIRGYEDAGCDEVVRFPTTSCVVQVDRLAEVICYPARYAVIGGGPSGWDFARLA